MTQKNGMDLLGKLLDGRVAIITGSAGGIGQAFATAFARLGASVVVADISDCSETLKLINDAGGQASAVTCDVSKEADVARLVEHAEKTYGGLDILINNAAAYPRAPFDDLTVDMWDTNMDVNAKGTFLCCKAAVPAMRRRGGGKIINISSGTIFVGLPTGAGYVASKSAIVGLSRVLARELGVDNILVNVITPGLVPTKAAMEQPGITQEMLQQMAEQQLSIKRVQQPEDLVGAAVFLASDMSNFITGQTINVDGGGIMH
jgi:NAD(P)-dependent dehydrogenase (short-subunit alcohol dehydrogenase family)